MTVIKSLWEFVRVLNDLPQKSGSSLYYRGHSKCKYVLEPSVFRTNKLRSHEHLMFKEFLMENSEQLNDDKTTLEKLVKMQHFGLPTRLLDITNNPLVALYFACVSHDDKVDKENDGEVIALSIPGKLMKYSDSETVTILSNLCKLQPKEKDFNTKLPRSKFNFESNVGRLLWEIKQERSIFYDNIDPKDINSIVPVKVKKTNSRIKAQSGLFLIFGEGINNSKLTVSPKWLVSDATKEKILIDKSSKHIIRKQLNEISISKSTLFPELEHSANDIKRKYL
jgi:hypothetical protein